MQKFFLIISLFICFVMIGINIYTSPIAAAKNIQKQHTRVLNKDLKNNSDKLLLIDKYQKQYFTIIKRNNILLNFEDEKALNADRKELKGLYKEVYKQISNKTYLKEYNKIEKKYSKCNDITTIGMNEFAKKNNEEIDYLLNTTYKKIQSKIPAENFENLVISEQKWLKEVDDYKKIYDSMKFGTIGTVIYYDYLTDMKSFRTLLLMLYL